MSDIGETPWVPLHEALVWAMWRGAGIPYDQPVSADAGLNGRDFQGALVAGKLIALGVVDWRGEQKEIPPLWWAGKILSIFSWRGCPPPYSSIYIDRASLLRAFPDASAGAPKKRGPKRQHDPEFIKAVADQVRLKFGEQKLVEGVCAEIERRGKAKPSPATVRRVLGHNSGG